MSHGLTIDGEICDVTGIAKLVSRSPNVVRRVLIKKPTLHSIIRELRLAHMKIDKAGNAGFDNQLRALGLDVRVWAPLVRAGIFTVDQLCMKTRSELEALEEVGSATVDLIEDALGEGRSLAA